MKKSFIKHKKRIGVIALIVIVIILAIIFFPKTTTVQTVVSEKVVKGDISLQVAASGTISAKSSYSITPRVSAKVLAVNVKAGDKVTKGQVLIKLDETDLQNAYKIAMYNFNAAVYSRDKLKALPVQDTYSINQAQQQVNSTYIQVQSTKNNINNATITSPIAGEVLSVNIKVDEYSNMASPMLIVADTANLEASLSVNEIDINKVKIDQEVELNIDAIGGMRKAKIISIDGNGINVAGIVNYIVKASIEDQTGLKANMTIDGDIKAQSKTNVLIVPAAALQEKSGKFYVKTVQNDGSKAEDIKEVEVTVGLNNNTIAEILSGVNENDKVVINIQNKTKSGNSFFGGGSN
jgi:HlyD family secretion protein